MKKFRSVRRAIKRGHLSLELDEATKQPIVFRRLNKYKKVRYFIS